jgi:spore germination protein
VTAGTRTVRDQTPPAVMPHRVAVPGAPDHAGAGPAPERASAGPPRRRRGPRRRARPAGLAWLAVVLAGAVAATATLLPLSTRPGPPGPTVVASLPFWDIGNGTATVLAHRQDFTEVSPFMYGLAVGGRIVTQYDSAHAAAVDAAIARLRRARLPVVPTLANITAGYWSYAPVARMLHDPALRRRQVAQIVALVLAHRYAGIDIDYENLRAADRGAFSTFITGLAAALHAQGRTLSVAVFAKTSNAGYGEANVAQDYAALGRAADQVRIMAYNYHWATSPPGPVAPIGWVRAVLRYARTQIPARKIILGVPLYGYDWSAGRGTAVSWLRAFQLATSYHATPRYDAAAQEPWFGYTAGGRRHVVWFENQASSRAKFEAAAGAGARGVFLWMFGYEDGTTWAALHAALPVPGRAP